MGWGSAAFAVSLSPETAYHTPPCCLSCAGFSPALLAISSHDPLSPPMPRRSGQQPWGKEVSEAKTSGASRGRRTLILGLEDRCTAVVLLMHFEKRVPSGCEIYTWGQPRPRPLFFPGGGVGVLPKSCALEPRRSRPAPLPTVRRPARSPFGFGSDSVRFYRPPLLSAADLWGRSAPPNRTAAESSGNMKKPTKP